LGRRPRRARQVPPPVRCRLILSDHAEEHMVRRRRARDRRAGEDRRSHRQHEEKACS
jgi:hypothetical protein